MNRREALQSLLALPAVGQIEMTRLKPADVIVIACDHIISQDAVARIEAQIRTVFPDHKCIVLDKGLSLKVVSEAGTT